MYNINIVVKPDETCNDTIEQICSIAGIGYDDFFAFSCILTKIREDGCRELKINCLETSQDNPFTPYTLITSLYYQEIKDVMYVLPKLEAYITVYRPMLYKMVSKVYPLYSNIISDKEDLLSILFVTIVKLYNKGYYLHNNLIYRAFINELNMEVRKLKYYVDKRSLDEVMTSDDNDTVTLGDMIEDPTSAIDDITRYDYREDILEQVKKMMSPLMYDRVLLQIKTHTITEDTSKLFARCREKLGLVKKKPYKIIINKE